MPLNIASPALSSGRSAEATSAAALDGPLMEKAMLLMASSGRPATSSPVSRTASFFAVNPPERSLLPSRSRLPRTTAKKFSPSILAERTARRPLASPEASTSSAKGPASNWRKRSGTICDGVPLPCALRKKVSPERPPLPLMSMTLSPPTSPASSNESASSLPSAAADRFTGGLPGRSKAVARTPSAGSLKPASSFRTPEPASYENVPSSAPSCSPGFT